MLKKRSGPNLIIFGIDGGTFQVIKPMVQGGKLPHLGRLFAEGTHGTLESTIPPLTAPAWATFFTGKNPGKHGIYDFVWQSRDKLDRPLVNASSIRGKTVWKILSERGLRVGLINVPMTYPPQKINGYIISGMLTPSKESTFTYPPDLQREIFSKVGDYPLDIQLIKILQTGDDVDFIQALFHGAKKRMKTARYLLDTREVDVFMLTFTMVDRLQHRYWRCMETGPEDALDSWKAKYSRVIEQGYEQLDTYIGELIQQYGQEKDIMILSDHGFGPLYRNFFINKWLTLKGFMALAYPQMQPGKSYSDHVDWSRTVAYSCFSSTEESIFINLEGREPYGIVQPGRDYEAIRERIMEDLKMLKDPISGQPVIDKVMKREEIYHGPMLERAPDIQFLSHNLEYSLRGNPYAESHIAERPMLRQESGYHRLNGIFMLKGEKIRKGVTLSNARLMDLAPTVLYLLEEKIPDDMDGKVLVEAFVENYRTSHPPEYEEAAPASQESAEESPSENVYSESEKTIIKETLKGLGYFD